MNRKMALLVIAVIGMMIIGVMGASAQVIRYADGEFSITATGLGESSPTTLTVNSLQLLGKNADGTYLIYVNEKFMSADSEGLDGIAAFINESELASVADLEPLANGSKGDAVAALQTALKKLDYLNGSADGNFGNMTMLALQAFQTDHGLEPTGEADACQQLLIRSMGSDVFMFDSSMDPNERFSVLEGRTDVNLEALYKSSLTMDYDSMEGTGFISDDNKLTFDASGDTDIDQAKFTLRYGFDVTEQNSGEFTVVPVFKFRCLCARRPVMQNVILKVGDKRCKLSMSNVENSLSGAKSVENGILELDKEALEVLSKIIGGNDLQIRVEAKYKTFDMNFTAAEASGLVEFCRVALAM